MFLFLLLFFCLSFSVVPSYLKCDVSIHGHISFLSVTCGQFMILFLSSLRNLMSFFLQHSYFIKLVFPHRAEEGRELLQTPKHMVLMWEVWFLPKDTWGWVHQHVSFFSFANKVIGGPSETVYTAQCPVQNKANNSKQMCTSPSDCCLHPGPSVLHGPLGDFCWHFLLPHSCRSAGPEWGALSLCPPFSYGSLRGLNLLDLRVLSRLQDFAHVPLWSRVTKQKDTNETMCSTGNHGFSPPDTWLPVQAPCWRPGKHFSSWQSEATNFP